jgi:hypothetical protein
MDVGIHGRHVECPTEEHCSFLSGESQGAAALRTESRLLTNDVQVCWIATLLYLAVIALVKCAILLEWVGIFNPRGQSALFTWISYATCGAIVSLSTILFIMDLANCTPFEFNWNPLLVGGHCRFDVPKFALASAIANSILDLIPLALAQKVIWGLRLSFNKKLGVSFMFLVGIL